MLFALALLQVGFLYSEVYVSAGETRLPYLTPEDFTRAANLQPALSDANFSRSYMRDDTALPETRLALDYKYQRQGGQQVAKFGGSCINSGVMSHELGHTLCFMHEQSRPDRDDYISWNTSKCTPHEKVNPNDWTTLHLFYDYVSLQHYEGECYNGCIKPKMSGVSKCGSGGLPSVLDIEKINAYYDCPGCYSYRFRARRLISYSANDRLVVAGTGLNNENLYPCRAYHNGDILPGKGDSGSCHVSYNGAEYTETSNFEVLSNPKGANLVWRQYTKGSPIPDNAIQGGRTAERETLYIGRCTFTDQNQRKTMIVPGKYHPSASDKLYIPYGGGEFQCEPFELLVCSEPTQSGPG
ncbi:unnamed protein product [Allacma fusca]|uniref:Peptidase M12A domain-containing protein n=1 Tax=Allacma fusca TaxID=39272 RepID=A0A8J2LCA7_9HEXA|nr:unnamed protein product [Allacma fusca]